MTETQRALLEKARDSVKAARLLLREGFAEIAASRAYYAMFYAAEALLEGEGLAFSKHSATIGAFGQRLAATGRMPRHLHRYILDAQDMRLDADYGPQLAITSEAAAEQITHAEEFLEAAETLLSQPTSEEGGR